MYKIVKINKIKQSKTIMASFISASVVFFTSLASFLPFYTKGTGSGPPRTEKYCPVSCCEDCNMLFHTLNSTWWVQLCLGYMQPSCDTEERACGNEHHPRKMFLDPRESYRRTVQWPSTVYSRQWWLSHSVTASHDCLNSASAVLIHRIKAE